MAIDAGRTLAATCANCHGTNGHSVGGTESLAGVPRELFVQFVKLAQIDHGKQRDRAGQHRHRTDGRAARCSLR